MPTWKKILHEDSSIAITQIANLSDIEQGQVIIGSGDGTVENHNLDHKHILVGDSSNDAKIANLITTAGADGGDVFVNAVSGVSGVDADVEFQIAAGVVSTAKLVDEAVTLGKTAHQANAGIVVYDDSVVDGTGVPTFLSVSQTGAGTDGEAGQVLKVKSDGTGFEFADAASASDVDISVFDATRRSVIIGGDADNTSDTAATIRKDFDNFTYKNGETFSSELYKDNNNSTVTAASISTEVANLHVPHIKTNITGTAGSSIKTFTTSDQTTNANFPVGFVGNGDSGAASHSGHNSMVFDKGFTYNPDLSQLTVENLRVAGTNTIVNTTTLAVDDKTIRVANEVSGSGTTTSEAAGSGLVVNIGENVTAGSGLTEDNADTDLPRLIWANDSTTTKGWIVATKGTGSDSNLAASTGHGIAVLNHNSADISQDTLNNSGTTYDHGVGAFFLVDTSGTPELYIQVA